jgi:LAS superfamily LD-carboxypeptidase LdcB
MDYSDYSRQRNENGAAIRQNNQGIRQMPVRKSAGRTRQKPVSAVLIVLMACLCALAVLEIAVPGLDGLSLKGALGSCSAQTPQDAGGQDNGGAASVLGADGDNSLWKEGDDAAPPLLVSSSHPLPDDYPAPKLVSLAGKMDLAEPDILIAAEIEAPLHAMLADAKAAGVGDIYVSSGYRTREEQAMLYDQADDKSYVQPPGASEHETGLAVDFWLTDESQQWLANNSWRYGFIVRYPMGKESITGISSEPWHFRYVGYEVARSCFEQDLCLEEYLGVADSFAPFSGRYQERASSPARP